MPHQLSDANDACACAILLILLYIASFNQVWLIRHIIGQAEYGEKVTSKLLHTGMYHKLVLHTLVSVISAYQDTTNNI